MLQDWAAVLGLDPSFEAFIQMIPMSKQQDVRTGYRNFADLVFEARSASKAEATYEDPQIHGFWMLNPINHPDVG